MDMGTSSMDMGTTGMAMSAPTGTAMGSMTMTGTAAMASSTAMSMSMGGGSSCKISMLWNWYTIDSCFLSSSWHVTSNGMFAGSCIGVILLVIALEFLRRAGKEYDRYIIAQHKRSLASRSPSTANLAPGANNSAKHATSTSASADGCEPNCDMHATTFRPNVLQQGLRALLHMLQFAVAYFVMLLAMYYNGYVIICIFIGAFLGYFIFGWETLKIGGAGGDGGRMQEEVTVCCG